MKLKISNFFSYTKVYPDLAKYVLRNDLFAEFRLVKIKLLRTFTNYSKTFWQNLWQKLPKIEQIKAEYLLKLQRRDFLPNFDFNFGKMLQKI